MAFAGIFFLSSSLAVIKEVRKHINKGSAGIWTIVIKHRRLPLPLPVLGANGKISLWGGLARLAIRAATAPLPAVSGSTGTLRLLTACKQTRGGGRPVERRSFTCLTTCCFADTQWRTCVEKRPFRLLCHILVVSTIGSIGCVARTLTSLNTKVPHRAATRPYPYRGEPPNRCVQKQLAKALLHKQFGRRTEPTLSRNEQHDPLQTGASPRLWTDICHQGEDGLHVFQLLTVQ